MNRPVLGILFSFSAIACGSFAPVSAQDTESKTPTCATPTAVRSGNQSPTRRADAPPTLHQPASSVLSRPGQTTKWTPKVIWESQPGSNGSQVQPTRPATRRPAGPQHAVSNPSTSRQNTPLRIRGQQLDTEKSQSVEMNFGDIDPCNPCPIPPACPTPLQSPWPCQESCVQTTPTPAAQSPLSACSPEELDMVPIPEKDPRVQIDDCSPGEPTPFGISTNSEPSLNAFEMRPDQCESESDKLIVETQEPVDQTEPDPALESLPPQDGDFIFENAAFQMPRMEQPAGNDLGALTEEHGDSRPASGKGIVIHPPMIQPYNENQHTFVIENQCTLDAEDVSVEISVPEHARIIAALPTRSVSTPQKAIFKFDELPAGDKTAVHLTVITSKNETIPFEASVASRLDYSFRVHGQRPAGVLKNVSYRRNVAEDTGNVQSIPGDDAWLGPVLVRNPFFQSLPNDHEAGLPANRR